MQSTLAWFSLLFAGFFEIGWPLGLKLADKPGFRLYGSGLAFVCMTISGALLWFALRQIPIGTAYAIWTGIGAAGTFIIGVLFFDDPTSVLRWLGCLAILSGVAMLKLAS